MEAGWVSSILHIKDLVQCTIRETQPHPLKACCKYVFNVITVLSELLSNSLLLQDPSSYLDSGQFPAEDERHLKGT